MKKQLFVLGMLVFSSISFSQSNVFPASGNVGIGTTIPSVPLSVLSSNSFQSTNLAYFAVKSQSINPNITFERGVYIKNLVSLGVVGGPASNNSTKFQYVYGNISTPDLNNKGYIEFNARASTNTTISAVSFGNNGSEFMRINQDGKVRIANGENDLKTPAGYRLFVEEGILTEKVKVAVKTTTNWSDFVFNEDYKLMPLNDVETFLLKNKHLPNVPSATEMVENGLDVAQMDAKLLEKVEELTLYIIAQNKQIEELKAAVQTLMEKK